MVFPALPSPKQSYTSFLLFVPQTVVLFSSELLSDQHLSNFLLKCTSCVLKTLYTYLQLFHKPSLYRHIETLLHAFIVLFLTVYVFWVWRLQLDPSCASQPFGGAVFHSSSSSSSFYSFHHFSLPSYFLSRTCSKRYVWANSGYINNSYSKLKDVKERNSSSLLQHCL